MKKSAASGSGRGAASASSLAPAERFAPLVQALGLAFGRARLLTRVGRAVPLRLVARQGAPLLGP